MLAHAIAHAAARDGTRLATRVEIAKMNPRDSIWVGTGQMPVGVRPFQRELESEADRLGVHIMASAGFDPAALAAYIDRMQPAHDTSAQVPSPLPPVEKRVADLEQAIGELPAQSYSSGTEFQAIQNEVRQ